MLDHSTEGKASFSPCFSEKWFSPFPPPLPSPQAYSSNVMLQRVLSLIVISLSSAPCKSSRSHIEIVYLLYVGILPIPLPLLEISPDFLSELLPVPLKCLHPFCPLHVCVSHTLSYEASVVLKCDVLFQNLACKQIMPPHLESLMFIFLFLMPGPWQGHSKC